MIVLEYCLKENKTSVILRIYQVNSADKNVLIII